MRRLQKLLLCILIVLAYGSPWPYHASAQDVGLAQQIPVVHAIMFWMEGCSHCDYVLDEVLPPLQEHYNDRLNILLIEVKSAEDVNQLYQAAAAFGIAKKDIGVPFLVIGETVLTGSTQIPSELPGLIEHYLAAGGVDYPDIPSLAGLLPTPLSWSPQASRLKIHLLRLLHSRGSQMAFGWQLL